MRTLAVSPRTTSLFLLKFVFVAFGWSWAFWTPATLAERGLIFLPIPAGLLETLGSFGPLVAAFALTFSCSGAPGLRALIGQSQRWRVAPIWYGIVLMGPFLYQLAAMGLHVVLGGQAPDGAALLAKVPGVLVNFVFVFFLIGVAEEFGWRGYLLPNLQEKSSSLVASLLVGVIWAIWHLPLFFNPGTSYSQTPFAVWLVFLLPYTVLHSWIYNSSRGSLLLSIALHAMVNVTGSLWMTVPDIGPVARSAPGVIAYVYLLEAAVLWGLAVRIVMVLGARHLSRQPRQIAGQMANECGMNR